MKRRFSFCAKLMAALTVSAAMMLPAFPVVAESGTLSMLEDNNIPVVYLTIDENAEGYGTIEEMNKSTDHSVKCTGTIKIDVPDNYKGD